MQGVLVSVSFVGVPPPALPRSNGETETRQSVWQGLSDPFDYRVLLRFPSEDAAQADLRQLVECVPETPLDLDFNLPTEVHHIAIEDERGDVLSEVPLEGYMVAVHSIANLGYGTEVRDYLKDTLSTFSQIEGCYGHLQGYNATMGEEAWAFVFGCDRASAPVPHTSESAYHLYRRIA
ncbi:hypothetical protein EON81_11755 [bacterium]|nr:MAG: hypothetical protein EON81_11755 [bacterium]